MSPEVQCLLPSSGIQAELAHTELWAAEGKPACLKGRDPSATRGQKKVCILVSGFHL